MYYNCYSLLLWKLQENRSSRSVLMLGVKNQHFNRMLLSKALSSLQKNLRQHAGNYGLWWTLRNPLTGNWQSNTATSYWTSSGTRDISQPMRRQIWKILWSASCHSTKLSQTHNSLKIHLSQFWSFPPHHTYRRLICSASSQFKIPIFFSQNEYTNSQSNKIKTKIN